MLVNSKVKIIMEELDRTAAQIPAYLEDDYHKAIVTALAKIDRQEEQERSKNGKTSIQC